MNKDLDKIDDIMYKIYTSHVVPAHLFGAKKDDIVGVKSLEIIKIKK